MTRRERLERRADRLREWAHTREQRAAAVFKAGEPFRSDHAFNTQPGHIPFRARLIAREHRACESLDKARAMNSRADSIEGAIASSIYDDDRDAIEQLRARIERLEAERARIKACNVAIRRHGLARLLEPDPPFALTDDEKRELITVARLCPYHQVETKGFPAYHLQNLGGNLSRQRARLKDLSGSPAPVPSADAVGCPGCGALQDCTPDCTATARAGLRIVATMTTPSRPGKQPRPVWNVTGNLASWRPMLTDAGGSWYRGVFSFWEDPADTIEAACLEAEFDEHQKADPHCTCPDCIEAHAARVEVAP